MSLWLPTSSDRWPEALQVGSSYTPCEGSSPSEPPGSGEAAAGSSLYHPSESLLLCAQAPREARSCRERRA